MHADQSNVRKRECANHDGDPCVGIIVSAILCLICAHLFASAFSADRDVAVGVDAVADQPQRAFEVAAGGLERVGVDRQRRAEHDQRRAVLGRADRLLERQPADGLHGDAHRLHHFAELVERAGHALAAGGDAAALVVADVVDDEVAAEVFEPAWRRRPCRRQTRLSPMTFTPKSRPALTTQRIVSSCARAMTTTCVAPALAIISASR